MLKLWMNPLNSDKTNLIIADGEIASLKQKLAKEKARDAQAVPDAWMFPELHKEKLNDTSI